MAREFLVFVAVALVAAVLVVLLRESHPQSALVLAIGASVVLLIYLLNLISPVVQQIRGFADSVGFANFDVLIKAIALGFVTEIAAALCRDSNQLALAVKIEIGGKIAIVAIALPLVADILNLVVELINL